MEMENREASHQRGVVLSRAERKKAQNRINQRAFSK
jgi:hypothetical protein